MRPTVVASFMITNWLKSKGPSTTIRKFICWPSEEKSKQYSSAHWGTNLYSLPHTNLVYSNK